MPRFPPFVRLWIHDNYDARNFILFAAGVLMNISAHLTDIDKAGIYFVRSKPLTANFPDAVSSDSRF
jgi:hypothetical protein